MTREDVLSAIQGIRDLHCFYDILTSDTPGAKRAWKAIDDQKFPDPDALIICLLGNKESFLRYCDDEGSRIRTAKTALLMYAASIDGRSKAKDDQLTNIVDNKIQNYDFEWIDASLNWSADEAIDVLKGLPLEDKVDIIEDVTSVFEAEGEITENQQGLIDHLKESFGIGDDEADDEDEDVMDEEKVLKINAIREYLLSRENTPYISKVFDDDEILTALNSSFVNDSIAAFINPPINPKTKQSLPELAVDFVVLKNGDVWCRTVFENEYRLDKLIGESLSTILKSIKYLKTKNGEV